MFCTACAAHNSATLPRCAACGASLPPAAARPGPRRAAGRGRALRLLLALPILIATLAGGYSVGAYRADRSALSAAYARGEAAARAGDYPGAIAAFTEAGTYADAEARRAAMFDALAPCRAAYLTGLDALEAGDEDRAIGALLTVVRALPDDEQAQALLAEARALRVRRLAESVDAAEVRRDWLGAERTLVELLAEDPDNVAYRARLATLSRAHAPVLYTREGAIYTIGPDLLDQRLVTDALPAVWPAWSPDQTRIAFFASNGEQLARYGLYVVNLDGSGLTKLAGNVRLEGWPAWSPDGTKIAYTSLERFELEKAEGIAALHVVDVATGADTDLTSAAFHYTTTPSWSPDGTRIAFINKKVYLRGVAVGRRVEGALHIVDLRTRAITDVVPGKLPFADYVTWSPTDEVLLVLSSELGSAWYETMITTIQRIDVRTGRIDQVTSRSQAVSYPIWSPDGSRFAFVEGDATVHVRSVAGARSVVSLPRAVVPFVSWSPDGSRLIAPSADPAQASVVVDLGMGGEQLDLELPFDYDSELAGPPQWSAARELRAPGPPTIGGAALDNGFAPTEEPA